MQNYNYKKIISKRSYNSTELSALLGINRKTFKRWVDDGLRVVEVGVSPVLVMGADVIDFIKNKRLKRKMPLKENDFLCLKCHKLVKAKTGSEKIIKTGKKIGKDNHEQSRKTGICEVCGTEVNKYLGVSQQD